MSAGAFNRQITIEYETVSKDLLTGAPVSSWTPLSYIGSEPERYWAMVRDALPSRSESVRNGLHEARPQTVIRIRWRADVTSAMRITIHGDSDRVTKIVSGPAEVGGRKKYLEMVVEGYSS